MHINWLEVKQSYENHFTTLDQRFKFFQRAITPTLWSLLSTALPERGRREFLEDGVGTALMNAYVIYEYKQLPANLEPQHIKKLEILSMAGSTILAVARFVPAWQCSYVIDKLAIPILGLTLGISIYMNRKFNVEKLLFLTSTKNNPNNLAQKYHRIPIIGLISAQILSRISEIGKIAFLSCRLTIACSRQTENSKICKAAWQVKEWIRKPTLVVQIAFIIASIFFIYIDAKKTPKEEEYN